MQFKPTTYDLQSQKGFTLIELLVVVAIIGMLVSIILVGLGSARMKSRDAKRLSDMQQIKTGLDLYYNTGNGYPDTATWSSLQSSLGTLACSGTNYFKVPNDPNPSWSYTYTAGGNSLSGCGGTVWTTYKVQFQTEGITSIGPAGTYYLSPGGISTVAPF
jgi:general secretion pathway protein G